MIFGENYGKEKLRTLSPKNEIEIASKMDIDHLKVVIAYTDFKFRYEKTVLHRRRKSCNHKNQNRPQKRKPNN